MSRPSDQLSQSSTAVRNVLLSLKTTDLYALRERFEKLPDGLPEGALLNLHTAVAQLLYVKSDAKGALPLLTRLEQGLKEQVPDEVSIPPVPDEGPTPPSDVPPLLDEVPQAPQPTVTAAPKKPGPDPKKTYVSKAFKAGISADLFNRPDSMPEGKLKDLCMQFNFVAKKAGRFRDKILDELKLNTGVTGSYDVTKLPTHIQQVWSKLHEMTYAEEEAEREERRTKGETVTSPDPVEPSPIPAADEIRKTLIGWKTGSSVDSLEKERPTEISTVKLNRERPKEVLVKQDALELANQQLAAANSLIRLEIIGKPDKNGFIKVRPAFNTERALVAKHEESHQKLVGLNKERQDKLGEGAELTPGAEGTQYVSWADCHRTAQTIMGSEEQNSGIGDTERVSLKGSSTLVAPVPKLQVGQIPLATDHGANRAMHGAFNAAMPTIKAKLKKMKKSELSANQAKLLELIELAEKEREQAPEEPVGKAPPNFRDAYRLIVDDETLSREFAEEFGVNEAIVPRVGTAFAQINDEKEKKQAVGDLWNFHFAGVVLVNPDGSYMTLENLSVEDSEAVNDNWYFAVYDPKKGKSFHEVNKKDSHVGKYPITLLFDKVPQ